MAKAAVAEELDKNKMVATTEMHCSGCGRFLGFQAIIWGTIKIKCTNCKEWCTLDIQPGE